MKTNEMEQFRLNETKRLIKFALDNPGDWALICNGDGNIMEPQTILMYIELLEENDFHYLIPVLLTNNDTSTELQRALVELFTNKIFGSPDTDMGTLCKELKDQIKKACEEGA